MRPHWTKYAGLLAASLLGACGGQVEVSNPTVAPAPAVTATITHSPAPPVQPTATATVTARPTITYTPTATQPKFASAEVLLESLVLQDVETVSGYPLKALTGWEMGFRGGDYCLAGPYRWLDSEHLMPFPIVGHLQFQEGVSADVTQPVVASLSGAAPWIVGEPHEYCQLPAWSQAAQRVIEAVGGEVRLRDLDGNVTASFPGRLPLELAPSGLRLLAGDTWIDLESGEVVPLPGWRSGGHAKVGWTEDEQRIFGCCFSYADVRTGDRWEQSDFPGFFIGGRGSWPGEELFSTSHWIHGETQVIVNPLAIWFFSLKTQGQTVIPLFNPAERRYVDLMTELNLSMPEYCSFHLAPLADQLWLNCLVEVDNHMVPHEEAHLVTLPSLQVVAVTGQPEFLGWSADGHYLVYNRAGENGGKASWLMTSSGESRQLADPAAVAAIWHPSGPLSALRFEDAGRLLFIDAASGQTGQLEFEELILDAVWQPEGAGIILITQEGRLWWLEDVFDAEHAPAPVTLPLPGIHGVRWSPDGRRVAFVSENDLFVVNIAGD